MESLTITDRKDTQDVFDIRFLRERGIALLQQYSGNIWTDYNMHDPGVTLLETLCLALAEVAYRADYSMAEILGEQASPGRGAFPAPHTVLPASPVTAEDLVRVLLGVPGVRNANIHPSRTYPDFPGLFDVEISPTDDLENDEQRARIEANVRKTLARYRKPGEDFAEVRFLEPEHVGFELDLEVKRRVDSAEFFHKVAEAIERYLSPVVDYFSLEELQAEGKDLSEIFEGPLLEKGFIPQRELELRRPRKTIYTSDLVTVLAGLEDVKSVRRIIIRSSTGEPFHWSYTVPGNTTPHISHHDTHITIRYKGAEIRSHALSHIRIAHNLQSLPKPFDVARYLQRTQTEEARPLAEYTSTRHDFPIAYGIGRYGLPPQSTPKREAMAHQFKGYLRIFDQVLFNALTQLAHVKELLSFQRIDHSYAAQLLADPRGDEYLVKPFTDEFLANHFTMEDTRLLRKEWEAYLEKNRAQLDTALHALVESKYQAAERRGRALSHLLARFGHDISFFEYVSGLNEDELIRYKEMLLQKLPALDARRSEAPLPAGNYMAQPERMPGFERRIALLAGLRTVSRKSLSAAVDQLMQSGTGEALELTISEAEGDEALELLFLLGGKEEMYVAEKRGDAYALTLRHSEAETRQQLSDMNLPDEEEKAFLEKMAGPRAELSPLFDSETKAYALAKKLSASIAEQDRASEGFHFIDHIGLRPADDLPAFGFEVLLGEERIFSLEAKHTRAERKKLLEDFLQKAKTADRYVITETGPQQFRITHPDAPGLLGVLLYSTWEEARAAVREYVLRFDRRRKDAATIRYTTRFAHLYPNIDDPFSNLVTFVLPSWPSRFQSAAYKTYVEETIARETPAHLLLSLRWLGYERMREFEKAWADWLEADARLSAGERLARLDKLMHLLAD